MLNPHSDKSLPATGPDACGAVRLKLRPDLIFSVREQGTQTVHVIEDPVRGKFFQVGQLEYEMLRRFDGLKTVNELAKPDVSAGGTASSNVGQQTMTLVANWLVQSGLATAVGADNTGRIHGQSQALRRQRRMAWLNPICLRIPLFHPTALLRSLDGLGRLVFSRGGAIAWSAIMILALFCLGGSLDELGQNYMGVLSANEWVWMLLVWFLLKVIHEAGHGMACRRFGGTVGEAGVTLILFTPLAYVDVTSSWRFPNRWHRIATAAGGMYFELFVAALAVIAWSSLGPEWAVRSLLYKIFLAASLSTLLFNANPLMKFDGYYILSDLFGIPNLYSKGQTWVGQRMGHLVLGWPVKPLRGSSAVRCWIPIYGILSFGWRILISVGLIIGASVLFRGAGIVLAVLAIFFWYGLPLWKLIQKVRAGQMQAPLSQLRLGGALASLALVVGLLFGVLSGPTSRSAPAIVQFENEHVLRAPRNAFVKTILVEDGESVTAGQLLAQLENRALELELRGLEEQIHQSQIRAKVALNDQRLAAYQAENSTLEQLRQQRSELMQQLERLEIRAPVAGTVLARNLEWQSGRFLEAGDTLLTIVGEARTKIVMSLEQADVPALKSQEEQRYRCVFPGRSVFDASLKRIDTRASTVPVHRALCADSGGPLPVRPISAAKKAEAGERTVELLSPRVNVEFDVHTEVEVPLHAGEQGRVVFRSERQSLGIYLFLSAQDWVERKVNDAIQAASSGS